MLGPTWQDVHGSKAKPADPRALERAAAGEAVVIPIILEDCQWKVPELKKLLALPAGAKAVRAWTPQAKCWKSVSDGLLAVFERLRKAHGAG